MSISGSVSMSENGNGLQGAVQVKMLKEAQNLQAQTVQAAMESIQSVSPGKGQCFDATA